MGQVMNKLKKGQPTQEETAKLNKDMEPIIADVCKALEVKVEKEKTIEFDDLYHAIYEIIQELRKKSGAMQYNLPEKADIKQVFEDVKNRRGPLASGPLKKDECSEIIGRLITLDRFSIGQGAIDILLYLFGVPICALMAKKVIPGMRSLSDDVVIPIATSGSVVFLVKSHKL